MTRLILVRHGQTESNLRRYLQGQSDGLLTEVGKQQVEDLSCHLRDMQFDKIISSDLKRAKNTAEVIAKYHGITVEEKLIVREWNCGDLDGLPAEALFKARTESDQNLADFRPERGETLREVRARAEKFLCEIEADFTGLNVIVCSHGDFLRMLIGVITQISIQEANDIYLNNASYSIFKRENDKWHTDTINNFL